MSDLEESDDFGAFLDIKGEDSELTIEQDQRSKFRGNNQLMHTL